MVKSGLAPKTLNSQFTKLSNIPCFIFFFSDSFKSVNSMSKSSKRKTISEGKENEYM